MTCKNHPVMTKALCRATVADNLSISENFYRLKLLLKGNCAKSFSSTLPGQFAEFELSGLSVPDKAQISENLSDASQRTLMLRRPFSFADVTIVDRQNVTLDVLYCVLGPGTLRMKNLKPGDEINLIGPLGNGFSIPKNKKHALLVAGGMGAPPIQHLAKYIQKNYPNIEKIAFVGAKSVSELPYFNIDRKVITAQAGDAIAEFNASATKSIITTDDGSAGTKGFVTEAMEKWIIDNAPPGRECVIYACGPEPMLKSVARIAKKHAIECQVSLERRMACGIGLCQSCAVEVIMPDSDKTCYKLCCKDGPVFDAEKIVW